MHRERLDTMLSQDLLLALVNIPQANVHQLLGAQSVFVLQPPKHIFPVFLCKTSQERNRHAVDVSAIRSLRRVDISMCIDPDDGNFTT
jgi:hypothetical protein